MDVLYLIGVLWRDIIKKLVQCVLQVFTVFILMHIAETMLILKFVSCLHSSLPSRFHDFSKKAFSTTKDAAEKLNAISCNMFVNSTVLMCVTVYTCITALIFKSTWIRA